VNWDLAKADLFILAGLGMVIAGYLTQNFYWARGFNGASNKRAPTWAGRLLYVVIGVLFMVFGFSHLLFGYGTID